MFEQIIGKNLEKRTRIAQIPSSALAWSRAGDLELEIDEGIETVPRKEGKDDECESRKRGPNGIRSGCKWVFLVAGFHQQIHNEQGHGEKAEHEERRGVLRAPSEVRQASQELHRRREGGGAEECQAQAKDIEGQDSLCPKGEDAGRMLRRGRIFFLCFWRGKEKVPSPKNAPDCPKKH